MGSRMDEALFADLTEYALGLSSPEDAARVEARLVEDPQARQELEALQRELSGMAELVGSVSPSPRGRDQLLADLEGPERYGPFMPELARIFDLSVDRMRATIQQALAQTWEETGVPGVSFVHFTAGPALAQLDTGLVRFEPEAAFPGHRHHGSELTFVLEGELKYQARGEVVLLRAGDHVLLSAADHHDWVQAGAERVVYATYQVGFTIDGMDED